MATNLFVQFSNNIKGECEADGHVDWCEITNLSQGFTNAAAPLPSAEADKSDSRRGKHETIKISKFMDEASIGLMQACWDGTTLTKVVIDCFRAGTGETANQPIKYFSIELKNVIIQEFKYGLKEGELVSEELELVAADAAYKYRQMDKKLGTATLAGEASISLEQDDFEGYDEDDDEREERKRKKREREKEQAQARQPVTLSHH